MTQKVLIAGATGMLGSRIAYYLLEQPETELRLLVRPGSLSDARKAGRISSLIERGAVVAHGDLTNRATLEHATKDVDVVILEWSDDRLNSMRAEVATFTKHVSSTETLDVVKADPDDNRILEMRRPRRVRSRLLRPSQRSVAHQSARPPDPPRTDRLPTTGPHAPRTSGRDCPGDTDRAVARGDAQNVSGDEQRSPAAGLAA